MGGEEYFLGQFNRGLDGSLDTVMSHKAPDIKEDAGPNPKLMPDDISVALSEARKWAKEGCSVFECSLSNAQEYAQRAGMDISAEVGEIKVLYKK